MKKFLVTVCSLLVVGCSTAGPSNRLVPLKLPDPSPVVMRPVRFTIVRTSDGRAWFAVREDGYKAMSLNLAELKRYILQQRKTLQLYREYYEYPGR